MTVHQQITISSDYTDFYEGDYYDWYQIHILSFNKVISTYFKPKNISNEQLKQNAENIIIEIIKGSNKSQIKPVLFEHQGKFLITYNKDIFDAVELFEFNPRFVRYEEVYDYDEFFDFIGETRVDVFIKNALITVGADELIPVIANQINTLVKHQDSYYDNINECHNLDKTEPKYVIEVFKIEKNYIPVKVQEIQSNDFERTIYLLENRYIIRSENRFAYIAKEIATTKVIENTIDESIENIKYFKYLKRNPPFIDVIDLDSMEMDSEDYDVGDDEVEYEEGDDEYSPH